MTRYTKWDSLALAIMLPIISILLIFLYLMQADLNEGILTFHLLILGFAMVMFFFFSPLMIYFAITEFKDEKRSLGELEELINYYKKQIEEYIAEKNQTTDLEKKLKLIKRIQKSKRKLLKYKSLYGKKLRKNEIEALKKIS